jgi:histidine triad (HIT) family protein
MTDCIFCRIIDGNIPASKVFEDDLLVAIEDLAPVAPLHLLVIPKKHIVNTLDLQAEDDLLIGRIHRVAASLAKEKGVAKDGFRIVTNNNIDAGQSVFHLHFHIIGGRKLAWPPG